MLAEILKATDYRPTGRTAKDDLNSQAVELVKGEGFASIGGNKPLKSGSKAFDKGMTVAKALRKNAARSQKEPAAVFKGLNPSFISEFGNYFNALPQNQAMTAFAAQVSQVLSDYVGKTIALTAPLGTGLVPYDLLAPSRLIYPIFSPLRNKLARTQGQGTSRRVKVFTGVSGSHTGGQAVLRWSIPEFPGGGGLAAGNWPNQLPGAGVDEAEDEDLPDALRRPPPAPMPLLRVRFSGGRIIRPCCNSRRSCLRDRTGHEKHENQRDDHTLSSVAAVGRN